MFQQSIFSNRVFSLSLGSALQNFVVKATVRSAVFSPEAEWTHCFLYRPWGNFYLWHIPSACLLRTVDTPTPHPCLRVRWQSLYINRNDGGLIVRQRVAFLDCTLSLPENCFLPFNVSCPNRAPSRRANTGESYTHKCSPSHREGTETWGTEDVMSTWGTLGVTPSVATGCETSDSSSHPSTHPN